jgi:hypothetical protein
MTLLDPKLPNVVENVIVNHVLPGVLGVNRAYLALAMFARSSDLKWKKDIHTAERT